MATDRTLTPWNSNLPNPNLVPQYRGEWGSVNYETADLVSYNGGLYISKTDTQSTDVPSVSPKWAALSATATLTREPLPTDAPGLYRVFRAGVPYEVYWNGTSITATTQPLATLGDVIAVQNKLGAERLNLTGLAEGTDISTILQNALNTASQKASFRFGGVLEVIAPTNRNLLITKQIVIPPRVTLNMLAPGVESENLEAGQTAILVHKESGKNSLFIFDQTPVSTFGYTRTGGILNFSAKLREADRGQGYMYVDLINAANVTVGGDVGMTYVEGFDTLYRLENSMVTTVQNILCRGFVTGMRATGGANRISTTHKETCVEYKGEQICLLARHLEADSVHDMRTLDVVYESIKRIGDIECGNYITEINPYAENIDYNGEGLSWYTLFKNGTSTRHANLQGRYISIAGVMAGTNNLPVHPESIAYEQDKGEVILRDTTVRRVQATVSNTANSKLTVLDHHPEQTGTGAQPNEYRKITNWLVVQGSVRTNIIAGTGAANTQSSQYKMRGYGNGYIIRPIYETHENDFECVAVNNDGSTTRLYKLIGGKNYMKFENAVMIPTVLRAELQPAFYEGMVSRVKNPETIGGVRKSYTVSVVDRGVGADPRNQWQYEDGTPVTIS